MPPNTVAKAKDNTGTNQEQKGTFDMGFRTKTYSRIFKQNEIEHYHNLNDTIDKIPSFPENVKNLLKEDVSIKVKNQLSFIKYLYQSFYNEYKQSVEKYNNYTEVNDVAVRKELNNFRNMVFGDKNLLPFDILLQHINKLKNALQTTNSKLNEIGAFSNDLSEGRLFLKNAIYSNYENAKDLIITKYKYNNFNFGINESNKLQFIREFLSFIDLFKVISIMSYAVIHKINHHFLITYFLVYNVTDEIAKNNTKRTDRAFDVLTEQYNTDNIQSIFTQKVEDEDKLKNIIAQCILSIFSFHQYAKHYHNNTGNINQAFVYNKTGDTKNYVKYILGNKVFYLQDMGYIVYIWGLNQGNKKEEEVKQFNYDGNHNQNIFNDYLKFFKALPKQTNKIPQTEIDKLTEITFEKLVIEDKGNFTETSQFEINLINYFLKTLLGVNFDKTKQTAGTIINEDYPCYLTKPPAIEYCFAVLTSNPYDIKSIDSSLVVYTGDTINFQNKHYTSTDKSNKKIKKYINNKDNGTTIYLIRNSGIESLHIAYVVSNVGIETKDIKFDDIEVQRIYRMYLEPLIDLTSFLTE
jgi:hypothetical protein